MNTKKSIKFTDVFEYIKNRYHICECEITGNVFYKRHNGKNDLKPFNKSSFRGLIHKHFGGASGVVIREAVNCVEPKPFNAIKAYFDTLNTTPKAPLFWELEKAIKYDKGAPFSLAEALENHMIRAIRQLYFGEVNRYVFVLVSDRQHIGKTTFINHLFPPELAQFTMCTLSGRDKKRDVVLATKFLVNADEFYGLPATGSAQAKAMLSQPTAALWIPFKNHIEQKPRIATFFSTANTHKEVLGDPSGSSRYIVFNVKHIDRSYMDINPSHLWAIAKRKALVENQTGKIDVEDIRAMEKYNLRFSKKPKRVYKSARKRTSQFVKGVTIGTALTALLASSWSRAVLLALARALGFA